jgi:type IV pilus assembly protein PilC
MATGVRMTGTIVMNRRVAALIDQAAQHIEKGETLRHALLSLGLFPGLLLRMLAVAESTGHTDDMLDRAADVLEEELDNRLGKLTTVLEPALIIVLSAIVGIILVSVILPVARIMNAVG